MCHTFNNTHRIAASEICWPNTSYFGVSIALRPVRRTRWTIL
jgi:hypothetical protein